MLSTAPAPRPERIGLEGLYVTLTPMNAARDGDALWQTLGGESHRELWRYMSDGPFLDRTSFDAHLQRKQASEDPLFYTIVDKASQRAAGYAALMRIDERNRVIEVGHVMYSPRLQQTRGATEAMYLLARYVFETLGYRRYEWKCHSENLASRAAAERLGFRFEGLFRQHMIVKGENRDTTWFAMLDWEWTERRQALEQWLDPDNFDEWGCQRKRLRRRSSA